MPLFLCAPLAGSSVCYLQLAADLSAYPSSVPSGVNGIYGLDNGGTTDAVNAI